MLKQQLLAAFRRPASFGSEWYHERDATCVNADPIAMSRNQCSVPRLNSDEHDRDHERESCYSPQRPFHCCTHTKLNGESRLLNNTGSSRCRKNAKKRCTLCQLAPRFGPATDASRVCNWSDGAIYRHKDFVET